MNFRIWNKIEDIHISKIDYEIDVNSFHTDNRNSLHDTLKYYWTALQIISQGTFMFLAWKIKYRSCSTDIFLYCVYFPVQATPVSCYSAVPLGLLSNYIWLSGMALSL